MEEKKIYRLRMKPREDGGDQTGRRRIGGRIKFLRTGDVITCQNQEEYEYLLKYEANYWEPETPEEKPKPKKKATKKKSGGGK